MNKSPTDKEILTCCEAVYNFLKDETQPSKYINEAKSLNEMSSILYKNGFQNMVQFTKYVNNKFSLGYTLYENNSYKNFFRNKSDHFYKIVIRKLKIKKLLI